MSGALRAGHQRKNSRPRGLGTQTSESDPERTSRRVRPLWYGRARGSKVAGDALSTQRYGSSPHGGVLVAPGEDHGCVSSRWPHQSDHAFEAWQMADRSRPPKWPELLEFGL